MGDFTDLRREDLQSLHVQLKQLQQQLLQLLGTKQTAQSWFTPTEFAREVGRSPAVVRHWCRTKRLQARKRAVGRGRTLDWEIGAAELLRFRDHGLLPKEQV